jgi:hypothetical protein
VADRFGRHCGHTAKHATDAGEQLAGIEGLGDVVVGADLESGDAVDGVASLAAPPSGE